MLNILKEFLVSIGFTVDSRSVNEVEDTLRDVGHEVSHFSGATIASLTKATVAMVGFVTTAVTGLAKFMESLAQTDIKMEMFSLQMYTSADNAAAFTNSLKAMGRTVEELYLSPELVKQFQMLQRQSFDMRPPAEYKEQMKFIRTILFEFSRLKLEVTYASQWIGYYLTKHFSGPLLKIRQFLKQINDWIVANMPKWTQKVAQVISWVGRLADGVYKVGKAIYNVFKRLPENLKVTGSAFLGLFTILRSGPIGWLIAGFMALLLLLDDFETYKRGGKSLFGDFWKWSENTKAFEGFNESLEKIEGSLSDIVSSLHKIWDFFIGDDNNIEIVKGALIGVETIIENIAQALKAITNPFEEIFGSLEDLKKSWDNVQNQGGFSKFFDEMKKRPGIFKEWDNFQKQGGFSSIFGKTSFVSPRSTNYTNKVQLTNTYHIYGTDPQGTARAVSKTNDVTTRNLRGITV